MKTGKNHIHFLLDYHTTDKVSDIVASIKQQLFLQYKSTIQQYFETQG